jgi:dTDP-4-dehydrorhamnose 3,5-epimerase
MTKTACLEWDDSVGPVPQVVSQMFFEDNRGHFSEVWQRERQAVPANICQINHSSSKYLTFRGLHWQVQPYGVGKFVTCLRGVIEDVVVDLRKRSSTFGQWCSYTLHGKPLQPQRLSVWVPAGFAHGFLVTSPSGAEVMYLQDGLWHQEAERSLRWDDPDVGIDWPIHVAHAGKDSSFLLSNKDREAPYLAELSDNDLFT